MFVSFSPPPPGPDSGARAVMGGAGSKPHSPHRAAAAPPAAPARTVEHVHARLKAAGGGVDVSGEGRVAACTRAGAWRDLRVLIDVVALPSDVTEISCEVGAARLSDRHVLVGTRAHRC